MPIQKTKTDYPITLSKAKIHLRVDIDYTNDDAYIQTLIKAATRQSENYIGKDLALTSNVSSIFDFSGDTIRINEGNFVSVENVITDTSTLVTVNTTKIYDNSFVLLLNEQVNSTTEYEPLQVEFTTGYTDQTVPEEIAQAILIKIGNMYDIDREDGGKEKKEPIDFASNSLLNAHKIILW